MRTIREIAEEYLASYRLRNPRSATFAEYAIGHVKRILGDKMLVDINEHTIKHYQDARLGENTAPKSINEEIGFLLRLMDVPGDVLRVRLRKKNLLKLKTRARIGGVHARRESSPVSGRESSPFTADLSRADARAERRHARCGDEDVHLGSDQFRQAISRYWPEQTEAGEGRTIPLDSVLLNAQALQSYPHGGEAGCPRRHRAELLTITDS